MKPDIAALTANVYVIGVRTANPEALVVQGGEVVLEATALLHCLGPIVNLVSVEQKAGRAPAR